jgi:2-dehydropantoate 2-reductase
MERLGGMAKAESAAAEGMAGPVLVWGAGAIGGTVGAALVRAGHAVAFVDIEPDHVAAIADPARGLQIEGPLEQYTVTAPAWLPQDAKGRYSRVLLCVKSQHTEAAARALLPHLADDGYVVSLQNGLCEPIIAGVVGAARTIGAFVNFSADWLSPGHIIYGGRGAVVLGELDGSITPRLEALHRLLSVFEPEAITTGNLFGYLWGKLGYASMLFAQGLGEKGIADCLARPELLGLWRAMGGEVMRVAAAEGVQPLGFNGFDPVAFGEGGTEATARASVDAMVAFNRPNAKTHSGIWRDLWVRRRRTEVDAQLAPVATIARRHGIPTPALDRLIAQIHDCEAGRRPMSDANLTELAAA